MLRNVAALAFGIVVTACGDIKNPDDRGPSPIGPDGSTASTGAGGNGSGATGGSGSTGSGGGTGGMGSGAAVVEIAIGWTHSCAVLEHGNVRCWGDAHYGDLGYGNLEDIGEDETPASAGDVNLGGKALHVAVGQSNSCAILEGGRVRCWGLGGLGQLGYGNFHDIGDDETPASAGDVNVGGTVVQIAVGTGHTCALLDTGAVRCWGDGTWGALGYANQDLIGDNESPASAGDVNVGGKVVQISAGHVHTCALLDTGAVRCWGNGTDGALGYGNDANIGDDEAPAKAGDVDVGGPVAAISAGANHTCGLLYDGRLRCWGNGAAGELGYGSTESVGVTGTPSMAGDISVGGVVTQVSATASHTCVILEGGRVRCWGLNSVGQLGYGNTNDIGDDETPASAGDVDVGGPVQQIGGGSYQTCALLVGGHVRCWGSGTLRGLLGYGRIVGRIGDDEPPSSAGDVPIN